MKKLLILPLLLLLSISSFAQQVHEELIVAPESTSPKPKPPKKLNFYGYPYPEEGKDVRYIMVSDVKKWTVERQYHPVEGATVEIFQKCHMDTDINVAKPIKIFEGATNTKGYVEVELPKYDATCLTTEYLLRTKKGNRSSYNSEGYLISRVMWEQKIMDYYKEKNYKVGDYELVDYNHDGKFDDADKYKEGVTHFLTSTNVEFILYLY